MGGWMEAKAGLRIAYSNQQAVKNTLLDGWVDAWKDGSLAGWMGGWMDWWMEAKAGLRIAESLFWGVLINLGWVINK